ncbi:hypothetical protein BGX33_012126 [Mortierella sp. NVP41]|nr:hypothetical protein BGX33_012126 [Mortierella sp. NVP41]
MTESSSVPAAAPVIDWADDTDDEIDFGAPVFSDDDELAPELAKIRANSNYGASTPSSPPLTSSPSSTTTGQRDSSSASPRYTAGFNDGSNRSLDRRSQNDSSLQTMSSRSRGKDYPPSYRDSPDNHQHHSSYTSPRGSTPVDRDRFKSGPRRDRDFGGDGRSPSFGSPQSDSSSRWTRNNNGDDRGSGQRPARQVIPLPPKPTVTSDRPHMDRSRSPSYRSQSPLPGTDRPRDRPIQNHHSQQQQQQYRTQSPPVRQPRTYMDQVIRANGQQQQQQHNRRPREQPSEARWEKTPHEDKPYPTLPPPAPAASRSPKDDTIYFLRREGRDNNNNNNNNSNNINSSNSTIQQSEPIWTRDLRKNSGTMYHERERMSVNNNNSNNSRNQGSNVSNGSNDRWGKATSLEPDLPYPERSYPSNNHSGGGHAKHSRTHSRGQAEPLPVSPSPPVEKTSARGTRGKGRVQKRRSKDQLFNGAGKEDTQDDKDGGSDIPWWEQSTYGAKKKEEPVAPVVETSALQPKPAATPKESPKPANPTPVAAKQSPKPSTPAPAAKSSSKSTPEPKEENPWWEQSTYGAKPKAATNDQANATTTIKSTTRAGQSEADTMARRKALGQKTLASGVESLTLVSRGDDSTGSSHSIKNRSVQERVFAEIKAMIAKYEDKYGTNKMEPIPPRSRQSEDMDTILESFRKLLYEQSVLCSLYAGNIPELTKALHRLVQELHPSVYKVSTTPSADASFSFAQIPAQRQTFLGLYILHHIAKPTRQPTAASLTEDPLFQTVSHPKSETDELVASFLYLFQQHHHHQEKDSPDGLSPDLHLALEYWRCLRQGNWIGRERLLGADRTRAGGLPISWEQRLMIRHSMGDSLGTARTISVATMAKAYYSLPVSVVAQGVGFVEPDHRVELSKVEGMTDQWIQKLKSSYGLIPSVIVRDDTLMFKAKS